MNTKTSAAPTAEKSTPWPRFISTFTKAPEALVDVTIPRLELRQHGAALFYLLVYRNTYGRLTKWSGRRTWTDRLPATEIAKRIGWSDSTAEKIIKDVTHGADSTMKRQVYGEPWQEDEARFRSYKYRVHNLPPVPKRGYIVIPNWMIDRLMPDLEYLQRGSFLPVLWVWRSTVCDRDNREGPNAWVHVTPGRLAKAIGFSKPHCQRVLPWLVDVGVLEYQENDGRPEYRLAVCIRKGLVRWYDPEPDEVAPEPKIPDAVDELLVAKLTAERAARRAKRSTGTDRPSARASSAPQCRDRPSEKDDRP